MNECYELSGHFLLVFCIKKKSSAERDSHAGEERHLLGRTEPSMTSIKYRIKRVGNEKIQFQQKKGEIRGERRRREERVMGRLLLTFSWTEPFH